MVIFYNEKSDLKFEDEAISKLYFEFLNHDPLIGLGLASFSENKDAKETYILEGDETKVSFVLFTESGEAFEVLDGSEETTIEELKELVYEISD